jgi:isoleucyl-tRNA synthetase
VAIPEQPSTRRDAPYPEVPARPDYPALEERILRYWEADRTFETSVASRPADDEFVFYDGPPFANGLPHYGHLLTGFVKDAVPRYQTMRGRRVERRFGWDCHGLPAEMSAEQELDVKGRQAIERFGVARFNEYCRGLVMRTADAWEHYVTRQARWVDFAHAYRTMDLSYMESVIWAFKQLYERGLIYESERVLPYCWECETPLSNFETRQDDAYREREDPAVTVAFELLAVSRPEGEEAGTSPQPTQLGAAERAASPPWLSGRLRLLVWTTTPWTLPSNLALAVNPATVYRAFDVGGVPTLVAANRAAALAELLGNAPVLGEVPGALLVGRRYEPLFPFFRHVDGAFVVLGEDFVATDEGTGIVHLAPGFGEEDHEACRKAGIPVLCPVDERARFTSEVPDYEGLQVFEANERVIEDLRRRGVLVALEPYRHSYPHCWRSDTPLVYKAVSSWFVKVTAIKDALVRCNQEIDWVPAHLRDGAFGKWLEGARDWSISRNRFWGAPIPVWKSDDPRYPRVDVYGSLEELERDFGVRLDDLHRPFVDELTRPNPDDPTGRAVMRRVPDVLDCWFESGSMPFAQVHYPFERREWFERHFPADFIVEYVGQTRGWFYTLHVLAVALFGKPAFRHCLAHGIVLGDDGRKMSKRLGNYPDPDMVFSTWGADAMRWFLLSSPVLRGQDLIVDTEGIEAAVREALNPIWNAWHFFALYANADGIRARWRTDASGVLDRYVLAKTAELVERVTERMDRFDLPGACAEVVAYLDALDNWYIRRSRDRFWRPRHASEEVERDKADAYDTLATVLSVLCRVVAPLAPMLAEEVYRGLTGERSVHLASWPALDELPSDPSLVADMDLVREVCSAAHAIRKAHGIRARVPLRRLELAIPDAVRLRALEGLIADEVNV